MFAASLPFPSHCLPGSALATGIRDALLSQSWAAHCQDYYAPQSADSAAHPKAGDAPAELTPKQIKPKRAARKPVRRVAMQTVVPVPAPGVVSDLPAELVDVADAVCMILGVGTMKRAEQPKAPTKPGKPTLGIGADALARIRVDEASDAWCAVAQDIPKRARARAATRAKAWTKWEGTPGARVGSMS
ncbi:hypothetical protein [Aeromonas caviae]|uniref:hypothetical protein n=1 Tax=Aeromonas caviae TaxID=648 RepID=UPI003F74794E